MTARRALRPALFWRVAIGNAAVLAAACIITALIFSPRVSNVAVRELAIFAGGLLLMLGLNQRAQIRLELAGGRPRLEIDDDGRGLDDGHEGGGIRGMRERAVLIGAALRVRESPLGGARVTLELPPV